MEKNENVTFEEAMQKLEQIVGALEEGNVPLEKAISLFQEGMNLSNICHEKLQSIEGKMDQIVEENGEIKSFSVQEDEA
ncbi:exodeoxyribonuclease VII small subunit [Guptibacillus hwajinpoensis]|uniref:Exodeoxyribonuclease VII small subunit n=2 Tax=Guptibacillus hwajinpoensis TaxID=208199 RepID=A0ABU0JZ74_9BACL|nr:exodeoxyribonuclease VII small subunit [Alkalihalobacillus macyae]MDQ0481720.1 exodeoxyribonuclease VII small subunit [Alkalihalobacillus hemicentroti]